MGWRKTKREREEKVAAINLFAEREGWAMFDRGFMGLDLAIERDDEAGIFPDDDEAQLWVKDLAEKGSELHKQALAIHEGRDRSTLLSK